VVIIGNGATAILGAVMAAKGRSCGMLQRSPSMWLSLPAEDELANWMNRWLPQRLAYAVTR
jgi:cation diffusion facilitator CzcD-associated flavoprotein CzcO